jgi:excisionase family DNA binding protein
MTHPPSPDEQFDEADPPQQPRLLTIQQTADVLQVGRCTAQELVLTGALRSLKIGRLRRIPPEAIEAFVEGQLLRGGNAA